MPCTDGGVPYPTIKRTKKQKRIELEEKVDYLTDLLCQAGRARFSRQPLSSAVVEWWIEHCEVDAERGQPW